MAILNDVSSRHFHKQDLKIRGVKASKVQGGFPIKFFKSSVRGFSIPRTIEERCFVDHKCPFTSKTQVTGRILKGMAINGTDKGMDRTIVVRRNYLQLVPKYKRYEKRHRNIHVHVSPLFDVHEGDIITMGECRPLNKNVRFNVLKVQRNQIFGAAKKQFVTF